MFDKTGLAIYFFMEWGNRLVALATAHTGKVLFTSTIFTLSLEGINIYLEEEVFGTPSIIILVVFATVGLNTIYGIKKSKALSAFYKKLAIETVNDTAQQEIYFARMQEHGFDKRKLGFVWFKCLSLLGYLFFATQLLKDGGSFFDYTAMTLTRVPISIFWYYEFKSIGENSAVLYRKKAPIFKIVELMFEPKLSTIFGGKEITEDPDYSLKSYSERNKKKDE